LRLNIAVIHGEEQKAEDDPLNHDGRQSPPLNSAVEDDRPGTSSSEHKLSVGTASYELFPVLVRF
jgi:hypothetical protein